MTEFKVGDKIRPKPGVRYDDRERRIEYVGQRIAVYSYTINSAQMENSTSLVQLENDFEVVEPFFEPGRTYKRHGYTFECIRVDDEGDGGKPSLAAYGRVVYASPNTGDPRTYMDIRRQFNNWAEEAPTGA